MKVYAARWVDYERTSLWIYTDRSGVEGSVIIYDEHDEPIQYAIPVGILVDGKIVSYGAMYFTDEQMESYMYEASLR